MRTLASLLLMASLVATTTVVSGCKKESPKGGPGATTTANPTTTSGPRAEDNTFSIKVPATVKVDAGGSEDFTVTLKPGAAFNQKVKVTFKLPENIKIAPASAEYKPNETDKKFAVSADKAAQEGDHAITVTGTPDEGAAVSTTFNVAVKKK